MAPEILYKFRAINKYTLASLINRSIWFSSPVDFNDPFDCQITIDRTEPSKTHFEGFVSREVQALANKSGERLLLKKPQGIFDGDKLSPGFCREVERFRIHLETQMKEIGVLSLSANPDSTTMWGHYSASHTGICIGYKTQRLLPNNRIDKISLEVEYLPCDKIRFNSFELFASYSPTHTEAKLKEIIDKIVSTKTDDWDYENEWRIIQKGKGNVHHGEDALQSIHFGLNCSVDDKNTIRNILHDTPMIFYQMIRSTDHLGIEELLIDKDSKYWNELPKQ